MATITITDTAEQAALNAILALIAGGTGGSANFEVLNSSNTSLAVMNFTNQTNPFASASSNAGIASATTNGITQSSGVLAGGPHTIANGRFRDKSGTAIVTFDIGGAASGAAMIVTDPVIPSNATAVSCSGVTVTLNVTV